MTEHQVILVNNLRVHMMRTGYQPIYIVDNETLTAVEEAITEQLIRLGRDPILECGKSGLYFKGCELVLKV